MQKRQLKRLIETGHYQPEPAQVAQAMLRRRGVRELLTSSGVRPGADGELKLDGHVPLADGRLPVMPADRTQSSSAVPRQAA